MNGFSGNDADVRQAAAFVALVPALGAVFCFRRKKDASDDCKTMQKLV